MDLTLVAVVGGIGWQELLILGCLLAGLAMGAMGLFAIVYLAVKLAQKKEE